MKIFYFTGTGNSLYIAKKIQKEFSGSELIPVAAHINDEKILIEDDAAGFVFPMYFFGLPKIIRDFIKKAQFKRTKYIFIILNAGMPWLGAALYSVNILLKEKGLKLNAGFYIPMADNYIINFIK
jgi:flavodoxin